MEKSKPHYIHIIVAIPDGRILLSRSSNTYSSFGNLYAEQWCATLTDEIYESDIKDLVSKMEHMLYLHLGIDDACVNGVTSKVGTADVLDRKIEVFRLDLDNPAQIQISNTTEIEAVAYDTLVNNICTKNIACNYNTYKAIEILANL